MHYSDLVPDDAARLFEDELMTYRPRQPFTVRPVPDGGL